MDFMTIIRQGQQGQSSWGVHEDTAQQLGCHTTPQWRNCGLKGGWEWFFRCQFSRAKVSPRHSRCLLSCCPLERVIGTLHTFAGSCDRLSSRQIQSQGPKQTLRRCLWMQLPSKGPDGPMPGGENWKSTSKLENQQRNHLAMSPHFGAQAYLLSSMTVVMTGTVTRLQLSIYIYRERER